MMKLEAYKQTGLQLLKCELNVGGLIGRMNNEHDNLASRLVRKKKQKYLRN